MYGPALLAALVLVGLLVVGRMAKATFEWWKKAAFSGQVVGKEARSRATGQPVHDATAIKQAAKCRFYLRIRSGEKTRTHEVARKVYQAARLGDHADKRAGTYECQLVPGASEEGEGGGAPKAQAASG